MVKVWYQHDQNVPMKINIDSDSDIDDLKQNIFGKTDKGQYQATYNGQSLKPSAKVPKDTTDDEPIVFTRVVITRTVNLSPGEQNNAESNKFKQSGIICAGGNELGNESNQLSCPHGIFIDHYKNIFIADCTNHRILEWKCHSNKGQIIVGRNGQGKRDDQLNCPTDVFVDKENNSFIIADQKNRQVIRCFRENEAKPQVLISDIDCYGLSMDKNGFIYVSDPERHEVRRWKKGDGRGTTVAGGHGKGDQLNQLNSPRYVFVDEDESLYVADKDNHRVMKWTKNAKEGIVVAGGNGKGNSLEQLSYPYGVIVDHSGEIYVADYNNDRVMRWYEGDAEGEIVVGGNGCGTELNQLDGPSGLSFDDEGNLYVADSDNHRILKYEKCLD
ncbi:unnamed protein product [Adineta steineri]|uniref:Uncharacterized protein n=1 Tax=Adineta steineri TaxID=433720 RepID=A0A815A5K8_9BILA|nr:unnamed protein product [Adineta steineri]CAF3914280.1 unnamed protein product [Adineta steineri]